LLNTAFGEKDVKASITIERPMNELDD
jgi:hypothetical protein